MAALTIEEAQKIVAEFVRHYPVAGAELAYKIRSSLEELYGPNISQVPLGTKGGYVPRQGISKNNRPYNGVVHIVANNNKNSDDLLATLQHEVIGLSRIGDNSPYPEFRFIPNIECPAWKHPLKTDVSRSFGGNFSG